MTAWALMPWSPGMGEIVLILVVVTILFGADQLPGVARSIGRWLHQLRRAADDFHDQLLDADRMISADRPDYTDDASATPPRDALPADGCGQPPGTAVSPLPTEDVYSREKHHDG